MRGAAGRSIGNLGSGYGLHITYYALRLAHTGSSEYFGHVHKQRLAERREMRKPGGLRAETEI